jgi:hypothetical protein
VQSSLAAGTGANPVHYFSSGVRSFLTVNVSVRRDVLGETGAI